MNRAQRRAEGLHRGKAGRVSGNPPLRCSACRTYFATPSALVTVTLDRRMLCAACAALEPEGSLLVTTLLEPGLPPWQRDDREFFVAHPKRHLRLREPFADEAASSTGSEATHPYLEAVLRALNQVDREVPPGPHPPLILVVRFGPDHRARLSVVGRPPPYAPGFLDSLARGAERLCPAPTPDESESGIAESHADFLAQTESELRPLAALAKRVSRG